MAQNESFGCTPHTNMNKLTRTIHPEIRIEDAAAGLATYIASDESVDSYGEVIRARGWKFDRMQKNAPFVNSHRYESIDDLLGKVVECRVEGDRLIETVKWAIDVPENQLAQLGWKMTQGGYLPAVSVGFFPVKYLTPGDGQEYELELGKSAGKARPARIYTEQQQVELSAVILPANGNAIQIHSLARAFKDGCISEAELEFLSKRNEPATPADSPDAAGEANRLAMISLNLTVRQFAAGL